MAGISTVTSSVETTTKTFVKTFNEVIPLPRERLQAHARSVTIRERQSLLYRWNLNKILLKVNLAKVKPRHIYLAFICFMVLLFCFSYTRYKMHIETIESGDRLSVQVDQVICRGNKDNQNYFVFRAPNGNKIVNVGKLVCGTLNVGDSVEVLYNSDSDLYFSNSIDTSDDKWGMIGSAAFMLIALFYLVFSPKNKRNRK